MVPTAMANLAAPGPSTADRLEAALNRIDDAVPKTRAAPEAIARLNALIAELRRTLGRDSAD